MNQQHLTKITNKIAKKQLFDWIAVQSGVYIISQMNHFKKIFQHLEWAVTFGLPDISR